MVMSHSVYGVIGITACKLYTMYNNWATQLAVTYTNTLATITKPSLTSHNTSTR